LKDVEAFRTEVREWLQEHCPDSIRTRGSEADWVWGGRTADYPSEDARLWLEAMADKGWTVPTWPREYGGGGLTHEENQVLQAELRHISARPALISFGVSMLGPVLLEFGNEAQKKEHLPKIAAGKIRWCQGYSEPGSGSDLASLQTRAVADGDDYIINGSKIWTSYAHLADWIFCLVRTDPEAPKHDGISFVLFDMTSPGVTARPIPLISGSSQFCETFFDNVRVPRANLVGTENEGWQIAKRLLQHERNMVAGMGGGGAGRNPDQALENQAKRYSGTSGDKIADASLRTDVITHKMNGRAFTLTLRRAAEEARTSSAPSPVSSMFKYYGTEQNKQKSEIRMKMLGTGGVAADSTAARDWLRSKGNSIEGGTSEVQLNVIAKRVLGLPD
jgi:alkylation response protein AidB-like acyl-CoA dehydrogenase